MKKIVLPLLIVCLLSPASARLTAQDAPKPLSADQLTEQAADAVFNRVFNPKTTVGLSVVVMRDGKIVLAKGYGKASIEKNIPVTPETRFAVGSVTKQFTCACILLLAEDGKLSVNDKVGKYFPRLTRANDISLLDLMNNVSGYPDYYPLDFVDRRMMKPVTPDRILSVYAGGKLDFEPGTRWSYSNTGFILLSRVVEKVAGKPFEEFLRTRILEPLGMTNTVYQPRRHGKGYAKGYTDLALSDPEPTAPEGTGWAGGAGAIHSTPTDLAKWSLALMDGKILNPESHRLMTTPRRLADGSATGYGCGLNVGKRNGATILSHGGAVSGFLTFEAMVPETRSALIYCTNKDMGDAGDAVAMIGPALLPSAPAAPEKPEETQSNPPPAKSVVPVVAGDSAEEAARKFFMAFQNGKLDGVPLGAEFRFFLNPERLKGASRRLKPLGELTKVEVSPASERGGMEVRQVTFTVGGRTLGGLMYRSPDGKIQQLLIR